MNRNCVIEIARSFAIDGHDWKLPKIAPLVQLARGDQWLDSFGFLQHLCRKLVGEVEFPNDDFDVYTEIVSVTKNFSYAAAWALGCSGPIGDFDIHDHILEIIPLTASCSFVAQLESHIVGQ